MKADGGGGGVLRRLTVVGGEEVVAAEGVLALAAGALVDHRAFAGVVVDQDGSRLDPEPHGVARACGSSARMRVGWGRRRWHGGRVGTRVGDEAVGVVQHVDVLVHRLGLRLRRRARQLPRLHGWVAARRGGGGGNQGRRGRGRVGEVAGQAPQAAGRRHRRGIRPCGAYPAVAGRYPFRTVRAQFPGGQTSAAESAVTL